ncbi:MAG: lamin tail domain-containing protein [Arenicella sp.]
MAQVSKRDLLKWTAPTVLSVALPAHAQTSVVTPPVVAPPAPPSTTGNIVITQIFFRQTSSADPNILVDEYIEVRNNDSVPIQMQDWRITDAASAVFVFPSRVLQPGETCRIFTHLPQGSNTFPCQETFGRINPQSSFTYVWNNTGDTATLFDATGATVQTCSYGSSAANPFSC